MSRPETTVVITAYNYASYLKECLRSIDAQTEPPARIVVVDDASTDDTPTVLHQIASNLRLRDRVVSHRNSMRMGLARSLNHAIDELVATPLVVHVDADDTVQPRFLEAMLDALLSCPTASYAYPRLKLFGEEQGRYTTYQFNSGRLMFAGNYIPNVALMRREHVIEVGGFRDLRTHLDWDLWLALLAHGYEGVLVDEELYNWRRHSGAMTYQSTRHRLQTRVKIQWRHRRLLAAHPAAALGWTTWAVIRRTRWGRWRHQGTLTESGWIET